MFEFGKISAVEERLKYFEDTEIVRRVGKEEAGRLSPKAKDCQKLIDEAVSVWGVDGLRFLFLFCDVNEDGEQKVVVLGKKAAGCYQRIKTFRVSCHDYIFEAIGTFVNQYFELEIQPSGYTVDASWFYALEDELKYLVRRCPAYLKPKVKLLRVWSEIMPKFNTMVADLDLRILGKDNASGTGSTKGDGIEDEKGIGDDGSEHKNLNECCVASGLGVDVGNRDVQEIVSRIDFANPSDIELIRAAQLYSYAKGVKEWSLGNRDTSFNDWLTFIRRSESLLMMVGKRQIRKEEMPLAMEALSFIPEACALMKNDALLKSMGVFFQRQVDKALVLKDKIELGHLEVLVYTRKYNKRLPKETSAYVKSILNEKVSSIGDFWDSVLDDDSLVSRLRKLWIQCMSLRLYNYDPNRSYTVKLLNDIAPEVMTTMDSEAILRFVRICLDSDFDTIRIAEFDKMIESALSKTTNDVDILKLNAAHLLYQAYLVKYPEPNVLLSESDSGLDSLPTPGISSPSSSLDSSSPNPKSLVSEGFQSDPTPEEVALWKKRVVHYNQMKQHGVSMKDYCLIMNLPYERFSKFYDEMMESVAALENNPMIQALSGKSVSVQKEYAELFKRYFDSITASFDSFFALTGEKIDVNDYFVDNEKVIKKIQKSMERVMADPKGLLRTKTAEAMKFMLDFQDTMRIQEEMRAFYKKHGLMDK